jgi:uncharacterized membrane protein YdbT with pleckstrin-like domain
MTVPSWLAAADETVVWTGQPRDRVVLQGVAAGVVGAAVVAVAAVFATGASISTGLVLVGAVPLALLAFAVPIGAVWLWRRTTHYVLTDRALYHRTGVVSVTVTELPLGKIQNTAYDQGVLGAVFGHGTVRIDTAGSEGAELTLRALDGPAAVHRRISERVDDARRTPDDVPGTTEQWRVVLEEVRRIRGLVDGE